MNNMKGKKWMKRILWTAVILFALLNIMAAFHAWKFTHFYEDGEVIKTPPEKWGFFDKTSAIVFGIRYPKSKNNGTPPHPFETIHLKTATGLDIEGWYIPAAADSNKAAAKGTVLLFHGHSGKKSSSLSEADYFHELGYHTLLIDFRAHGNSQGNTCTIGKREAEEVKLAYDHISNKGEKNIILWGISMGAATITAAMDQYKITPSKIILEMPFGTLLHAVKGRVRMMGLPQQPIAGLLAFWGGTEQGFWAFGYQPAEYVKQINCPVLLQWGANDPRVTRSETESLYQNIAAKEKKWVIYENSAHQSLCTNEPDKWKAAVKGFLEP
jgi:uncharacterized protein